MSIFHRKSYNEVFSSLDQQKGVVPVSPSSVPLPETPAPVSASVKSTKAETIKPLELSDPTPEQLKLREEAEKYHQQQLQQQQEQGQNQQEIQKEGQNVPQEDTSTNEKGQVGCRNVVGGGRANYWGG